MKAKKIQHLITRIVTMISMVLSNDIPVVAYMNAASMNIGSNTYHELEFSVQEKYRVETIAWG